MYEKKDPPVEYVKNGLKKSGREMIILPNDYCVNRPMKTLPLYDGQIFDLGDRSIEIIGIPGHTAGTVVLLDRSNSILFSGDACNINTLLCLPPSTSLEEYRESLIRFKQFQPYFTGMWGGHGLQAYPKTLIDEAIELCDEIFAGTDDAVESDFNGRSCFYGKKKDAAFHRLDGKTANIAYTKDKLYKN
jgi:glyoxylase-like metal-dependent hydrolase (beta-lactamase superfamily II)